VIVLWHAILAALFLLPLLILFVPFLLGQDASSGAIRETVADSSGHPIVEASVALVDSAQGFHYFVISDSAGQFMFEFLPPGGYAARAVAPDMSPELTPKLEVHASATTELDFKLQVGGAKEMVTVSGEPPMVETESHSVSSLVDKRAIEELPLDGRRFTDRPSNARSDTGPAWTDLGLAWRFGFWRHPRVSVELSGRRG
jgi:hypothetical protein